MVFYLEKKCPWVLPHSTGQLSGFSDPVRNPEVNVGVAVGCVERVRGAGAWNGCVERVRGAGAGRASPVTHSSCHSSPHCLANQHLVEF